MRIAIIGGGISGLVSAYLLNEDHDIVLFEANDHIGGHTDTIDVTIGKDRYAMDTGFIVINEVTNPNFLKLLGPARRQVPAIDYDLQRQVGARRHRVQYA